MKPRSIVDHMTTVRAYIDKMQGQPLLKESLEEAYNCMLTVYMMHNQSDPRDWLSSKESEVYHRYLRTPTYWADECQEVKDFLIDNGYVKK